MASCATEERAFFVKKIFNEICESVVNVQRCYLHFNLLAPEFGIQILAHPVCKM